MKQLLGLIILVCWGSTSLMSQAYHYYYAGEQIDLDLNTEYAYLRLKGVETSSQLANLIGDAEVTSFGLYDVTQTLAPVPNQTAPELGATWAEVKFPSSMDEEAYFQQLAALSKLSAISLSAPYFAKGAGEKIGLSDLFLVKLSPLGDPNALFAFADQHAVSIIGQNRFMPEWYTLSVTESSAGNALEMANIFHASGQFAAAEPDLMVDPLACVNDPLWNNQYHLNHGGQYGGNSNHDINACSAWASWTKGDDNIKIAVLDHGYEQNHPDLAANNFGGGFDTETGTTPAKLWGNHGTACAGIAGAVQNNGTGVTGVAPGCSMMSISNKMLIAPNFAQRMADGLNWAWMNGADVISNSWRTFTSYSVITDAVINAINNGRGGLGTVVCFATGNEDAGSVAFPGYVHPDVVTVGASSPCGERKNPNSCDGEAWWGGNYGTALDVVAPGVKIPTTDRQGSVGYSGNDYLLAFNGTSSACPQVAGLAGLILSMNPCLSQRQVGDIIEASAQKIGGYSYANTAGRENGTWNNEMGYGLIDMDQALRMTRSLTVQNTIFSTNEIFQVQGSIYAGNQVTPSIPPGPVYLLPGSNVDFIASNEIILTREFHVSLGATFDAIMIDDDCVNWNENLRELPPVVDAVVETAPIERGLISDQIEETGLGLTIAPNPFSDALSLRFNLASNAKVKAELYDLQGRQVAEMIPLTLMEQGHHQEKINLSSQLPAGIYFVKMLIDDQIKIEKLIKH